VSVALPAGDLADRVERLVIGADYGADGYTTRAQADELARRLDLRPGVRLLELGSGRGWPGIHLARSSGCHVVLTDLPVAGLRVAAARAAVEGLTGRYGVAAASGAHLPFRAETLDAVVHADVLC
jgi:cyclopropane fatty-acyl-phospholipid synthase-like methyltransferase